jgi:hypothetical protein
VRECPPLPRACVNAALVSFAPEATLHSGAAAAAEGRALLEAALGGSDNVARAIRGRRPLDGARAPGYRSPLRSFRLPEAMDVTLTSVSEAQHRKQSDVIRDALAEYFERHSV